MRPVIEKKKLEPRHIVYIIIIVICIIAIGVGVYMQFYQDEKLALIFGITKEKEDVELKTLKEKQFEYYTSNENFILLQKPTCVIKNEDIKQVKVVSLFQLFGKGYSKKKNHFMIKYVVKDKKNNLNNINMNDNDVDDVVFTANNEEVVMKWVLLLNRVILYNEV